MNDNHHTFFESILIAYIHNSIINFNIENLEYLV